MKLNQKAGQPFTALNGGLVPAKFVEWFGEPTPGTERLMTALMKMHKLDIAALERAFHGR
ncbi:MAG TPA: hypothetical protein VGQ27_05125 [Steroidobacteraceae bacterium]|jgi:hypothetical protein|nr:hypothetical protein [Steroidobacteraceae bacterium]